MRCCEHRRDAPSGIRKAGWRGRGRVQTWSSEMTMLSVIGARVIRHGRTGGQVHTGLIRHVTSDTRSLITLGIAHIGHMSHPPHISRHQTSHSTTRHLPANSQEGIKLVQRIQRQKGNVMKAISSYLDFLMFSDFMTS